MSRVTRVGVPLVVLLLGWLMLGPGAMTKAPPRNQAPPKTQPPLLQSTLTVSPPRDRAAVLVSDTGGAIRAIVLQLGDMVGIPMLVDITMALPAARVYVAVERAAEGQELLRLIRQMGGRTRPVTIIRTGEGLTLWARDSFLPLSSPKGPEEFLVAPSHPGFEHRLDDRAVPSLLASKMRPRPRVHETDIYFEGGNIVSDERRAFTGYNGLELNAHVPHMVFPTDLSGRLVALLGRPVVLVGSYEDPPPHDHIDMYLTPLGHGRVLVGDPSLAVQAVDRAPAQELVDAEARFDGTPGRSTYDGRPFSVAQLVAHNRRISVVGAFDRVAQGLEAVGFVVERIPLLAGGNGSHLPVFTYNNVVMESDAATSRVLMPTYGLPSLDVAAYQVWRNLGFEVETIATMAIADLEGAVRCVSQVLERAPLSR